MLPKIANRFGLTGEERAGRLRRGRLGAEFVGYVPDDELGGYVGDIALGGSANAGGCG